MTGTTRHFGVGPLSRAAALVHTLLVVELLLLATTGPGLVLLALLGRDASNLPLAAACLVPVGPAFSAALYALRHQRLDLTELHPAAVFWRGYRTNLAGVLRIWVPALLWLTVIAVSLAHRAAAGVPPWWTALLVLVAAGVVLGTTNALVIVTLFRFRARDVLRLALHFLVRAPGVGIGTAALLVAAAGITVVGSDAVLALLGSVLALALLRIAAPMVDTIRKEFTA